MGKHRKCNWFAAVWRKGGLQVRGEMDWWKEGGSKIEKFMKQNNNKKKVGGGGKRKKLRRIVV